MARSEAFSQERLRTQPEVLFATRRVVAFQDVDAAGTIFFPRVLEYFSDAYVALLLARGIDLPGIVAAKTWLAPFAHAEADYLGPLRFGDEVLVEVVCAEAFETSYRLGYRLRSPADPARAFAVGQTVHVAIDATTFRPVPVPDELRAALSRASARDHSLG